MALRPASDISIDLAALADTSANPKLMWELIVELVTDLQDAYKKALPDTPESLEAIQAVLQYFLEEYC